jgi:hypothetical protein
MIDTHDFYLEAQSKAQLNAHIATIDIKLRCVTLAMGLSYPTESAEKVLEAAAKFYLWATVGKNIGDNSLRD